MIADWSSLTIKHGRKVGKKIKRHRNDANMLISTKFEAKNKIDICL